VTGKGWSLLSPFYFVADKTGRNLSDVRAMPGCEFFSWLRFHGFDDAISRSK
jgi:hypothetical protein